jgi:hypothetical protein
MTRDRDYYRALTNKDLVDEAKNAINPDWHELAIVLAERLEKEEFNPANWNACPRCGYED